MTDKMTTRKAIKILENTPYLRKPNGDTDLEYKGAIDMAIEALEKQIPKKPVTFMESVGDYEFESYECPVCGCHDSFGEYGCGECGHAIDWSDTE